ncbi:MAG: primosomal protein N' [Pseudomonadota bacterium]
MPDNSAQNKVLSVAVPVPLRQTFDFLKPASTVQPVVGGRVQVPFGKRKLVGIVVALKEQSDYPAERLKEALEVLDDEPLFEPELWATLHWISRYYLAPIGEVLEAAMPVKLRQGEELKPAGKRHWQLSEKGRSSALEELNNAPLQLAILKRFMRNTTLGSADFRDDSGGWRQAVRALLEKGWLVETEITPQLPASQGDGSSDVDSSKTEARAPIVLNTQQRQAVDTLQEIIEGQTFACSLLHGVTGSGKTEVYFAVMKEVLKRDQQVLFLVPEIGLTPQLLERVRASFDCPISVMHSGLNESERHLAWWHGKQGNAGIVIGTRSAVFSSVARLGLIIVDEEHDGSFKQQDGVRYQARDVAIYRAKQENVPIVLGSATPSLESYANARQGRYFSLRLEKRATRAALPEIELFDTNVLPCTDGLSPPMLEAIGATLDAGKQVMLFLNRRGFAPVLYCKSCYATTKCHRCDSHLTLHRRANRMRCHHCGYEGIAPEKCGACEASELVEVGEGTQRVEDALALRFPDARVLRIDRDSTRRKGELADLLTKARDGKADILLGTQLLTKGHDFPSVAMVGVLDADQGLYSTDFRSSETLFQQLVQVAGRAGRRDAVGRVYIQTAFPTHPFFAWVRQHDFDGFAEQLLAERQRVAYPPFGYFALLRAESTHQARALQFLRQAKQTLLESVSSAGATTLPSDIRIMDAIPAPMERRAGRYRAQLLVCAKLRSNLNNVLSSWLQALNENSDLKKQSGSVRWSLDVDPLDHY